MTANWTIKDIPNQQDKVVVITGANSGIGYESALALAGKEAQVILAVRSEQKGRAALQSIKDAFPKANAEVMLLDLASLNSVRKFAEEFKTKYSRLDVLLNNAGMMAIPFDITMDGFEMQFGINHLGHFTLTGLLLPVLLKTPASRVVTVSSHNHMIGRMDFDNLDGSKGYRPWRAYNQTKLANLLFAYELQRKLKAIGAELISVGTHPGYTATNLQFAGPRLSGSSAMERLMKLGNALLGQSGAIGALPLLYASVAPNIRGGDYTGPKDMFGLWGYPKVERSSGRSHDIQSANRLWEISEQLTGVHYVFQK